MPTVHLPASSEEHTSLLEERLRAVTEIAWAIGSPTDLDSLLRAVMEQVTRLVHADRSTLFVLDEERRELWSRVLQGEEDVQDGPGAERIDVIRLPLGQGIAGWVAREDRPVILEDAYEDPRFDRQWDRTTGYRTESLLAVPIHDRDQAVVGVIQCLNKVSGFTLEDQELLQAVGGQVAVALENAFLYRELVQRNRELQHAQHQLRQANAELGILYDLEQRLARTRDEPTLVRAALARVCEHLDAEACALLLDDGGHPRVEGWLRAESRSLTRSLRLGEAEEHMARLASPIHLGRDELATDPGLALCDFGDPGEILSTPLTTNRQVIGVLQVCDPHVDIGPVDGRLRLTSLLASQIARALDMHRSHAAEERAQRLSLVGQAVSAILHDLRNPMGAVQGYAEMMAESDEPQERLRLVGRIERALSHMESMTREVLEFARGDKDLLLSRVYLNGFVVEAEEVLAPMMGRRGISLVIDDQYGGPARFDRSKLLRVVTNLARNAVEAMDDGGTLTWTIARSDDALTMDFEDTGRGIPEDRRARLFEFFTTWGKDGGTGLGLAMARRFLEAHGGQITCLRSSDDGTTFRLVLPVDGPPIPS